mmetsp:Transcript_40076/g.107346  ORF Transcript_40076/g.107346 Transcript_40076/m.107346 type:complete len:243 (+) Transcript_40076:735-1463(+)
MVHSPSTTPRSPQELARLSPREMKRLKSPRSVTTGSEKWLRVHNHASAADCIEALRAQHFKIFCAKPENPTKDRSVSPVPLKEINFGDRTALVFGNEKTGISAAMSELGDSDFTIPMMGLTESFNVSVAAAISIHWGRHAREVALGKCTDLSEAAAAELMAEYQSAGKHYRHKIRQGAAPGLAAAVAEAEAALDSITLTIPAAKLAPRLDKDARREAWLARNRSDDAGASVARPTPEPPSPV